MLWLCVESCATALPAFLSFLKNIVLTYRVGFLGATWYSFIHAHRGMDSAEIHSIPQLWFSDSLHLTQLLQALLQLEDLNMAWHHSATTFAGWSHGWQYAWRLSLICLSIASVFNVPAWFTNTEHSAWESALRSIPARARHFLPLCISTSCEHSCDSCEAKVANCSILGGRTALLLQIPFLTCSVDGCMATL